MPGGSVLEIPPNIRGFDCNRRLTVHELSILNKLGYRFACRYIPRSAKASNDLSVSEIYDLFQSGLAVMPVQHVESATFWIPKARKGLIQSQVAVEACKKLGLPSGTNVWLDLEGVDPAVLKTDIIDFCSIWYQEVLAADFTPGLYVGWHCGLSPKQLYYAIPFQHYWGAYNLDRDQEPAQRGLQIKQHTTHYDVKLPPVFRGVLDLNVVARDLKGGLPWAYAPDEWDIQ